MARIYRQCGRHAALASQGGASTHSTAPSPHQLEEVAEVTNTPVRMLPPEVSPRAEHMLQVLQECRRQGLIHCFQKAACAAVGGCAILITILKDGG